MSSTKHGKIFEQEIEQSCKDQNIFYFRVRDVNIPPDLRYRIKLPQNKYDSLIYYKGFLFPIEMKSTKQKSISLKDAVIKENQIRNLKEATQYENVIPGFLMNFREHDNQTFFIHINDFITYKNIAENQLNHSYKNKINKSSIPLDICKEIGVEVINIKKKVRYRYYVNKLLDELINRCS